MHSEMSTELPVLVLWFHPQNRQTLEAQPIDYEKPGLGQHYCVECAKYYETDIALRSHWRSKVHKRRCKQLKEPAYTIEEAERAAGLGREGKRPTTILPPSTLTDDVPMSGDSEFPFNYPGRVRQRDVRMSNSLDPTAVFFHKAGMRAPEAGQGVLITVSQKIAQAYIITDIESARSTQPKLIIDPNAFLSSTTFTRVSQLLFEEQAKSFPRAMHDAQSS
ncbi:hypothetical protein NM688_g7342 [Phlebia brevispora]|uniref:Uncharacterized protein n=1 Tax=Phlebia brevispora TaxID=194682 RepID=A0ACC1S6E4_9APHY|nr:hypothetical protein NM688_g7342 [Phlebia brevispora]